MSFAKPSPLPRHLLLAAVLLGPAVAGSQAEVFPIQLGDEAAVSADVGGELRYDDNIYLTNLVREGDFVATAVPGLLLDFGKTGATRLHAEARMQFVRYLENSQENDALTSFSASGQRHGPRTQWSFDGSYNQIRANSREYQATTQLVRYDTTSTRLSVSRPLSPRMDLDAGITFNDVAFQTARFVSSRDISIPVNLYRAWTPRIGGGLQYRFRTTSYDRANATDSTEHSIGFGTRGEFTSTLSGRIGAAIAFRSGSGTASSERLRADLSLVWNADARTTCTLTASSDAQPSGSTGSSYENIRISLGATRQFSAHLSGRLRVSQEWDEHTVREDDAISAEASLQVAFSEDLVAALGVEHEDNNSNLLFYNFTRTVVRLSTTYRF